jgi:hypothetical protein
MKGEENIKERKTVHVSRTLQQHTEDEEQRSG